MMQTDLKIGILCGGPGSESEVSRKSGRALHAALSAEYETRLFDLESSLIPETLWSGDWIVFPALHGEFGEGGQLQQQFEEKGVVFSGSGSKASRLCIDKRTTKKIAAGGIVNAAKDIYFAGGNNPLADDVIEELGTSLVIKPNREGSSFGLSFTEHRSALGIALSNIRDGDWLIEERIKGREVTVGVLDGEPMGVVEIHAPDGQFDYTAKYSKGMTDYSFPADLDSEVTSNLQMAAKLVYDRCECRDFVRVDFIIRDGRIYILEVNTLPGLTETSLLPKSASCCGFDFNQLAKALVRPAIERFRMRGQ